jgi:exopolysaccharide biosynthesis polyprenyl glycosylphosphotransferase
LLPPTNDIPALLKGDRVEELVIATDRRDELPTRALVDCRLGGIRIGDYETFHGHETGRIDLDYLSPEWFFVEDGFHAGFIDRWSKRTLDVLLSIVLLIATLPLSLLVSLAIWLEDGGNVLYRQTRVGRGGKVFHLVKFRSMRRDAEADGIPRWTANGDDRVTSVGRALRVTHLDELPQLWNILKGEMSIVGPRPERPYFVERLADTHPYFLDRHAVKPGLAGWAQINCPYTRSEHEARRKLEYDLYYVKYGSVLMDFVILLQTVRVVFWPSSAR